MTMHDRSNYYHKWWLCKLIHTGTEVLSLQMLIIRKILIDDELFKYAFPLPSFLESISNFRPECLHRRTIDIICNHICDCSWVQTKLKKVKALLCRWIRKFFSINLTLGKLLKWSGQLKASAKVAGIFADTTLKVDAIMLISIYMFHLSYACSVKQARLKDQKTQKLKYETLSPTELKMSKEKIK